MKRTLLKSKLHCATVTQTELHDEGSDAVNESLLEAVNLVEHERVEIYNVSTGLRSSTCVVRTPRGSDTTCATDAAARLASVGDRLIVAASDSLDESEVRGHQPGVVRVDEGNRALELTSASAGLLRP